VRLLLLSVLLVPIAASLSARQSAAISDEMIAAETFPAKLSAFGFFNGSAAAPGSELIPYTLATPLFSDYAEKQRFIYLPRGSKVSVAEGFGRISFPVGAAIIKSFGYLDGGGKLGVIETRVLLHRKTGWTALPYIWNADGSDADLRLGGGRQSVNITRVNGVTQRISYAVPNKNQCKQCHLANEKIEPIGPLLGNMQFANKADKGRLLANASMPSTVINMLRWDDKSANIDQRARSYLYVNCAHCHRPSGSASNSGLYFDESTGTPTAYGIGKHPVAAGRGSGGNEFVIVPGHPEQSILLHRMKSLETGVSMPELGRATVHDEGVSLLEEWIRNIPAT
jgi:uncharacterized repeat protein (TIGR03806 family)